MPQLGSTNTPARLLTRRTTESQSSDNHPPEVDNSYTRQRITPNLVPISTVETANPFSITYPILSLIMGKYHLFVIFLNPSQGLTK